MNNSPQKVRVYGDLYYMVGRCPYKFSLHFPFVKANSFAGKELFGPSTCSNCYYDEGVFSQCCMECSEENSLPHYPFLNTKYTLYYDKNGHVNNIATHTRFPDSNLFYSYDKYVHVYDRSPSQLSLILPELCEEGHDGNDDYVEYDMDYFDNEYEYEYEYNYNYNYNYKKTC